MKLPIENQIVFAKELIAIAELTNDVRILTHLYEMSILLMSLVGDDNGIAVSLNEYIAELVDIANGGGDAGWRDEFKSTLLETINDSSTLRR